MSDLRPTASIVLTKLGNGSLAVNNLRMNGVAVNSGALQVIDNGTNSGASKIGTISFGGPTPTGSLDLVDNALIVTTTPRATLTSAITFARNGGAWDQAGLTSSAAAENPQHSTTLGLMSGTEYFSIYGAGATFAGQTVAGADSLIKYTYYGDTDFNGIVNFDDYARVDAGFNNSRSGWINGDFDFNGVVNFDDYALIDLGFNTQGSALAMQAVPEPTTTSIIGGLVAFAAATRRRRT